jgi:hypothetical protein
MKLRAVFAAAILALVPTLAARAAEIFSPGLPATGTQFLECRIINITNASQTVTSEGLDSNGAVVAGPVPQTLAPGQAGGFSVSALAAVMYCKFTVSGPKGATSGFRASIDVLDTSVPPNHIVVALPAE